MPKWALGRSADGKNMSIFRNISPAHHLTTPKSIGNFRSIRSVNILNIILLSPVVLSLLRRHHISVFRNISPAHNLIMPKINRELPLNKICPQNVFSWLSCSRVIHQKTYFYFYKHKPHPPFDHALNQCFETELPKDH